MRKTLSALFVLLLFSSTSYGGWILEQKTEHKNVGGKDFKSSGKSYYQGAQFRTESKTKYGKAFAIFTGKEMLMCNEKTRTCMKKLIELGNMMGGTDTTEYTGFSVKRLKKTKKVAGKKCTQIATKMTMKDTSNGEVSKISSVACHAKYPGGKKLYAAMKTMLKRMKEKFPMEKMAKTYLRYASFGPPLEMKSTIVDSSGKMTMYVLTTKFREKKLSSKIFKRPKGYKIIDATKMMSPAALAVVGGTKLPNGQKMPKMPKLTKEQLEMIRKSMPEGMDFPTGLSE